MMRRFFGFACVVSFAVTAAAADRAQTPSAWPQKYTVKKNASRLVLTTPYYTVQHDAKRGGAISGIRLTHGRATNLLMQPISTRVIDGSGSVFSDAAAKGSISHRSQGKTEIVEIQSPLVDENGRDSGWVVRTRYEYHWGYIKIHKEITGAGSAGVREVCPVATVLTPTLTDYGYREGKTEEEGAPAFAFGSNKWGKFRGTGSNRVDTQYMPRSVLFAHAGTEGLEWFAGSELSQWDLQLSQRRGEGRFLMQHLGPAGVEVSISPFSCTNTAPLPKPCAFDYYIGIPLLEGNAANPWLHTSFNRNRGEWVSPEQIRKWAESGIQTVHCHNDGDYYQDGLFWRDGSYPPYPDMDHYNKVLEDCHASGIRAATYFSNKELHPSTREYQEHGLEWGRMNKAGRLQHNTYRGTNEFGAQMCLRSGWLDYLKFSIDRVLKNHPLDGVYYDWNVALLCCNPLHEGKKAGAPAAGHWDIDELLDLMEWTRERVGPKGLVIVHNTTTPMYTTENFADYVVANEWGYGTWKENGPALSDLPLEWSLVGARPRGVISYGQLKADSPRRLHRVFALQALLSGVTPWPASPETFELARGLKPLGDLRSYRFSDWRNDAVKIEGTRCASAVYGKPGEAYVMLANMTGDPQKVRCYLKPSALPFPMKRVTKARLLKASGDAENTSSEAVDIRKLTSEGVELSIPGDSALLLHVR